MWLDVVNLCCIKKWNSQPRAKDKELNEIIDSMWANTFERIESCRNSMEFTAFFYALANEKGVFNKWEHLPYYIREVFLEQIQRLVLTDISRKGSKDLADVLWVLGNLGAKWKDLPTAFRSAILKTLREEKILEGLHQNCSLVCLNLEVYGGQLPTD